MRDDSAAPVEASMLVQELERVCRWDNSVSYLDPLSVLELNNKRVNLRGRLFHALIGGKVLRSIVRSLGPAAGKNQQPRRSLTLVAVRLVARPARIRGVGRFGWGRWINGLFWFSHCVVSFLVTSK